MVADQPILSEPARQAASPRVSVILATYGGRDRIGQTLASLEQQTLPAGQFETIVVSNGPDDGTAAWLAAYRRSSALTIRLIRTSQSGVSMASNLGLGAARGEYMTWVDDDDWLSPTYLADLLEQSAPNTIVLAPLADVPVDADGRPIVELADFNNYVNRAILLHGTEPTTFANLQTAASLNSGKLVPTRLARAVRYDQALANGQDVVYWAELLARFDPQLVVLGPAAAGRYYRTIRQTSLSRQLGADTLDARLSVITHLSKLADQYPAAAEPLRGLIKAQAGHIGRYLREQPGQRPHVMSELSRLKLNQVPLTGLNHGAANRLVVAYAFPPFSDTSGTVVAKRLVAADEPFDLLTQDMKPARHHDQSLNELVAPLLGQVSLVGGRPSSDNAAAAFRFAQQGAAALEGRIVSWGPYETIYSRSMWPAAHVAGALLKSRCPTSRWVAEFSDPLAVNSNGEARLAGLVDDPIRAEIEQAIRAGGWPTTASGLYFEWLEDVVYALADEIVFTNPLQRDLMLGQARFAELAERAAQLARVEPHPTLPAPYYQLRSAPVRLAAGRIHLGYFGMFYAVRGPGVLLEAVAGLTRLERAKLCLHIYTDSVAETSQTVQRYRLGRSVQVHRYLPYLEFLDLTRRLDWLIVTDAASRHPGGVNPYLPSKLSDYRGSGSRIWGIVEPGSILSRQDLDQKSELGNPAEASAVLRQIIQTG